MLTPAAPDGPVAVILDLFVQVHEQLRDELGGVGEGCLNFVPGPGMNSIAVILRHLVGSEAETLRALAGVPHVRDRSSEFEPQQVTVRGAQHLLAEADRLLEELASLITSERLDAEFTLPTLPSDDSRPGLAWLVGNYGHAREHVGQIQVTKQLHASRPWREEIYQTLPAPGE